MKKIELLVLTFFTFINIGHSQFCNIHEAEQIAKNLIKERFNEISEKTIKYKIVNSQTFYNEDIAVFHVINLEPEGFVIISAQKCVYPILAFSNTSKFELKNNPAAEFWIENYSKQIKFAEINKIAPEENIILAWRHYNVTEEDFIEFKNIKTISPLLKTTWNQGRYYNSFCPADPAGPDGRVVVGCVATALGQIMNYFRHPYTGVSSYGYNHPVYGLLEVDFSQQTYDYDYMPIAPNDYNDNLARLLYNIGVSVDMNYGPNGSGMYNHKGAYTLRTYFDYNPATTYYFRDTMPPEFNWTQNLIDHLDQNIPLYYAGWSDYQFVSGHAFVLDGYSSETHYHVNWGWGGSMDGYYYINDLTPGTSDFTLLHEVISFAVPNSPPKFCNDLKIINSYEGVIEDGSGPLNNYLNNSECNWLIIPNDSANGIKLNFLKFDVEQNDVVIIFDGDNEASPILASYYGGQSPSEIITNSDKVLIKFISDDSNSADGWLLKYEGIRPTYCNLITYLYEPEGYINDGSGNYNYLNQTTCNWRIEPPNTENILITFDYLDTEPVLDYVKILNSSGQTVLNVSGNTLPEPVIIYGHKATVMFKSNAAVRAGGFSLHYQTNVTEINHSSIFKPKIFPNPVINTLNICSERLINEIQILSVDSKTIKVIKNINQNSTIIDLSDLQNGMYLLLIYNEQNNNLLKFVKQ